MYRQITELKNIHKDKDIWIICAGSSMNYVEPNFFDNKITIGLNQVYRHFPCDYIAMTDLKESSRFDASVEELKNSKIKLLFSKYSHGCYKDGESKPEPCDNFYVWNHNDNCNYKKEDGTLDMDVIGTDKIVSIRSTVTSAMNISAYMGAKNIIICGADNGSVNGKSYYDGYVEDHWISAKNNDGWLGGIRDLNLQVREKIKEVYGCNIYSLNPFWNFGLEGNEYKQF
jgi:hypothetical protein